MAPTCNHRDDTTTHDRNTLLSLPRHHSLTWPTLSLPRLSFSFLSFSVSLVLYGYSRLLLLRHWDESIDYILFSHLFILWTLTHCLLSLSLFSSLLFSHCLFHCTTAVLLVQQTVISTLRWNYKYHIYFHLFIKNVNSVAFQYYRERQGWVRSLSRAPTNAHCWESNPRTFGTEAFSNYATHSHITVSRL